MARAGHAAADIDAAFALVLEDAKGIDEAASPKQLTDLQKARVPRNWSYAAQTTRRSVGRIFEATGGTAVYDGSDIQRSWRDINAAAQHYAFIWDNAMVDYGRALLGLAALHAIPKKR
jgi:3-hydroxy-9,10-secoandrosta-1,3,5(10)-triene-9,17-dione monooxygenase